MHCKALLVDHGSCLASYPGAQRGGVEEERKKERLVSTACACATSGGIPPPPVPFAYVRVALSIFITWLAASVTFDEALSFAIQRLSCPSMC